MKQMISQEGNLPSKSRPQFKRLLLLVAILLLSIPKPLQAQGTIGFGSITNGITLTNNWNTFTNGLIIITNIFPPPVWPPSTNPPPAPPPNDNFASATLVSGPSFEANADNI